MKRVQDLLIAVPLFLLTLPLQIAIGIAVLLSMGPPVLFLQKRPGLNGRPFTLFKFRTMRPEGADDDFQTSRVTRLGGWLRRSSIDELPELVNVILGNMSLIGPRPLLMEYLHLYNKEQARRHDMKPGITGLAQVCGRNRMSWQRRLKYDVWYVTHHSLCLDLRILYMTVAAVFRAEGINQNEAVTMEPFRGMKNDRG